ncbi:hypothetical protein SLS55_006727 [Diplodia seriata]|uniref:Uncharacterized protein n=1 Tax=Diplodia seriata TaxID=420778 RepID=A0ABR3CEZ4_9PEZI
MIPYKSSLIKGWMGYIAWLEQDLKERSDRITLSKLGARVKDFTFSVNDRQALKLTEDAVIDLQTIASTMLNTVEGLSDLLRYEDQRALKELTEQSADESKAMLSLAVRMLP